MGGQAGRSAVVNFDIFLTIQFKTYVGHVPMLLSLPISSLHLTKRPEG